MQFIVRTRQNLTACDTIFRGSQTCRTIAENVFQSESEAISFYEQSKNSVRFFGLAGQFYTYPEKVSDDYKVPKYFCDTCGNGFESDAYTDLDGDFCSKTCFRNDFQDRSEDFNEQYDDDY